MTTITIHTATRHAALSIWAAAASANRAVLAQEFQRQLRSLGWGERALLEGDAPTASAALHALLLRCSQAAHAWWVSAGMHGPPPRGCSVFVRSGGISVIEWETEGHRIAATLRGDRGSADGAVVEVQMESAPSHGLSYRGAIALRAAQQAGCFAAPGGAADLAQIARAGVSIEAIAMELGVDARVIANSALCHVADPPADWVGIECSSGRAWLLAEHEAVLVQGMATKYAITVTDAICGWRDADGVEQCSGVIALLTRGECPPQWQAATAALGLGQRPW